MLFKSQIKARESIIYSANRKMFGKAGSLKDFWNPLASGKGEALEAGELSRSQVSNDLVEHVKEF